MKLFNLLLLITLFFSACGKKIPFKEKEPLKETALVYVYTSDAQDFSDDVGRLYNFKIRIDNKQVDNYLGNGEYMPFNIKPGSITISATKDSVVEKKLDLNLLANHIYYLKINIYGYGHFDFQKVTTTIGYKDIQNTTLANSYKIEESSIITKIVDDENSSEEKQSNSKTDEIKKAYKMKVDGLITDEEYKKLKNDILYK